MASVKSCSACGDPLFPEEEIDMLCDGCVIYEESLVSLEQDEEYVEWRAYAWPRKEDWYLE